MTCPPILLLVFNRPAVAARLLDAVRPARPARLFVAADGPRPDRPGDADLCARTREVFRQVDWPCQVATLYRETNLGLQAAVISAISWFFSQVEAGVIFEDDCLPSADFFPFAGELLDRFANDTAVMHISGLNMRQDESFSPHSYFFTRVGHIWGWATWRRAWQRYDVTMADWPSIRSRFSLRSPPLERALGRKFAAAHARRKATWSRIWYYTVAKHQGLAIVPSVNFIRNVGFGPEATHTTGSSHPLRHDRAGGMVFPLDHPAERTPNAAYERHLAHYHNGSYAQRVREYAWMAVDQMRVR
jgi:hypothetical protein